MPSTFLLGQNVDLGLELGVRGDRAGLGQNLTTLDIVLLDATQEAADVVARLGIFEDLVEHLHAGDGRLASLVAERPTISTLGADFDLAALDTTRDDGATTLDREDVLDGHEEVLVHRTLGCLGCS